MVFNIKDVAEFINRNKDLTGVINGELAFTGPELLQIDLTNACNNNCIACWCRSPLLGRQKISQEVGGQTLPTALVKQTLRDCAEMGTTNIYLAGGGEPFMHPDIMDIIAYIKGLGLRCHVNTNFTLVTQERARRLHEMGVDNLIVSLWAATAGTYLDCHPNQSKGTFAHLVETIRSLVELKNGGAPHIKLYNVIMNRNYHEVESMAEFAMDLQVDAVEYTVADVIPGRTDSLLLTTEQRKSVLAMCRSLDEMPVITDSRTRLFYDEFRRRLSEDGAENGNYDTLMLRDIPCFIGWNFSRILADGNVNACLKSHRIPVGNIHDATFRTIWNCRKQREFRRITKSGNEQDPFFTMIGNDESSKIGCHRGCDDIERNARLWKRLEGLSLTERFLLKGMGYYYKASRTGL